MRLMHRIRRSSPGGRAATGAALLEALVALLIVSLLSAAMLNQQQALQQTRTAARQRLDALQLARLAMEGLHSPATPSSASTAPPPFKLTHGEASEADGAAAVRDVSIAVDWHGPAGEPRRLQLGTREPGASPVYDAVLGLAPQDIAIARPLARATGIPFESVAIAPGQSLWQPGAPGSPAWVFDDADGTIVARCTGTAGACGVPDPPAAGWSGRVEIEPLGWRIGTQAGSQRVCRYSADLDGSGAIDRNDEHPARYTAVQGALAQQNYLVIRGDQPCPADSATGTHNDALQNTVQHQP